MKSCSDCHHEWVEDAQNRHKVCPSCGSEAVRDSFGRGPSRSLFSRMFMAFVPSIIALCFLFIIVSVKPTHNLEALDPILNVYALVAVAAPVYLLFWAVSYLRHRHGPAGDQILPRAIWSVLLASGMTFLNYCIAFGGCALVLW